MANSSFWQFNGSSNNKEPLSFNAPTAVDFNVFRGSISDLRALVIK